MPNVRYLVIVLFAAAVVAPACGGGDCDKLYDMEKKCSKGDSDKFPSKSEFGEMCEKAKSDSKHKDEVEGELGCAKEDSCEGFAKCKTGLRGKKRAKRVATAVAESKWKDAWDDCTLNEEYFSDETFKAECAKAFANADKITGKDASSAMFRCQSSEKIKAVAPAFGEACTKMATAQLAAVTKAATEARDGGKRDYKACLELKDAAEGAGGPAVAAAKTLCDELDVAEDAKKAVDEATANAGAKKTSMPYECDRAAEKLMTLETEWGKKTMEAVGTACYGKLGPVIVAEKGKDAKYVCPYEITKVLEAVQKYKLEGKFPELDEALKKLPKTCTKA